MAEYPSIRINGNLTMFIASVISAIGAAGITYGVISSKVDANDERSRANSKLIPVILAADDRSARNEEKIADLIKTITQQTTKTAVQNQKLDTLIEELREERRRKNGAQR